MLMRDGKVEGVSGRGVGSEHAGRPLSLRWGTGGVVIQGEQEVHTAVDHCNLLSTQTFLLLLLSLPHY